MIKLETNFCHQNFVPTPNIRKYLIYKRLIDTKASLSSECLVT